MIRAFQNSSLEKLQRKHKIQQQNNGRNNIWQKNCGWIRKKEKKRISLTWEKFFKNIGNRIMSSRESDKMKQLDLEEVKDFLEKKGIATGVELKPMENGVYWLSIKQEFQTIEEDGGTIIKINGFILFVKNYTPLVGFLNGKAKKASLLKPVQAVKA